MITVPCYYRSTYPYHFIGTTCTVPINSYETGKQSNLAKDVLRHGLTTQFYQNYRTTANTPVGAFPPPSEYGDYFSTFSVPDEAEDLGIYSYWSSLCLNVNGTPIYKREWWSSIIAPYASSISWNLSDTGSEFYVYYKSMSQTGEDGSATSNYPVGPSSHKIELLFGSAQFLATGVLPTSTYYDSSPVPAKIILSDQNADALDRNPGAASVRVTNECGLRSSAVVFQMAPRAFCVATLIDGGFETDAFKTVDLDHGVSKIEWFCKGTPFDQFSNRINTDVSATANNVNYKKFDFAWDAIGSLVPASNFNNWKDGDLITFTEKATDRAGLTDTFDFTVRYTPTARARFIVRPAGDLLQRDKSILWQHRGMARAWAGEPATGNVLSSDDEGATWNQMSNAWNGVSGAKPLDFEHLPHDGACSLAKVGARIQFRASGDGVTWDAPVDVCDAGTASSWCVRVHDMAGKTTLSITDMVSARFDSEDLGATWSAIA